MKSIFLSIRPEWLCKILNREKTIEGRKLFPKDYVGWVCLYCSKGNDRLWKENDHYWHSTKVRATQNDLNGKVVARFWCDKVERIWLTTTSVWLCENEISDKLYKGSCLSDIELDRYFKPKQCGFNYTYGYAIHISKLEIFDKSKELSEFYRQAKHETKIVNEGGWYIEPLTKAPQNYCYVEA